MNKAVKQGIEPREGLSLKMLLDVVAAHDHGAQHWNFDASVVFIFIQLGELGENGRSVRSHDTMENRMSFSWKGSSQTVVLLIITLSLLKTTIESDLLVKTRISRFFQLFVKSVFLFLTRDLLFLNACKV